MVILINCSNSELMKIFVTGVAEFIGFNLSRLLLNKKLKVVSVDNINDHYSIKLKNNCLKTPKELNNF